MSFSRQGSCGTPARQESIQACCFETSSSCADLRLCKVLNEQYAWISGPYGPHGCRVDGINPLALDFHVEFRHEKEECTCIPDPASPFLTASLPLFSLPHCPFSHCLAAPFLTANAEPPKQSWRSLSDDLAEQFLREETADVWFEIGNDVVPAHKWILVARVEVFEKMSSSGMQEATTNRIPRHGHPDVSANAQVCLLRTISG